VKHQVLILDDEPEVRRVVRQQLSGTRFDVLEAETAEQAMDLLRDYAMSVDVVICDVRMPGVSGVEAVSYIREAHPTKPIIVLTGHPDLDLAVDFMKSGVVDYIVKPVEKDNLIAAVEKAAAKHQTFDPHDV
jgi:DNA-binding NtrC family response regulator